MSSANDSQDNLSLAQKLNLETAKINWKELEVFFAKGVLIRVNNTSDLVETATKIAGNQHNEVEKLINNAEMDFINADWIRTNCQDYPDFWAVVVSPYVICQLVEEVAKSTEIKN